MGHNNSDNNEQEKGGAQPHLEPHRGASRCGLAHERRRIGPELRHLHVGTASMKYARIN